MAKDRKTVAAELRRVAGELRTRPVPLRDLIPLLTKAADTIDQLVGLVNEAKR